MKKLEQEILQRNDNDNKSSAERRGSLERGLRKNAKWILGMQKTRNAAASIPKYTHFCDSLTRIEEEEEAEEEEAAYRGDFQLPRIRWGHPLESKLVKLQI